MRVERFMNFDTHAAVKRLIAVGLQDRVAEEVVTSIALSRDYDFSKLVTKEEFAEYRQETSERFNKIETEIALIKQEIKAFRKETKADIEALRKESKAGIETLRKENKSETDLLRQEISILRKDQEIGFTTLSTKLSAEIAKSKHDTLKWIIGLFIIQVTSVMGLLITIFIKSHL